MQHIALHTDVDTGQAKLASAMARQQLRALKYLCGGLVDGVAAEGVGQVAHVIAGRVGGLLCGVAAHVGGLQSNTLISPSGGLKIPKKG